MMSSLLSQATGTHSLMQAEQNQIHMMHANIYSAVCSWIDIKPLMTSCVLWNI